MTEIIEDFVITEKHPNGKQWVITREIAEQFEEIRKLGPCNMMDKPCVLKVCYDLYNVQLAEFIESDRKAYVQILQNYDALNRHFGLREDADPVTPSVSA